MPYAQLELTVLQPSGPPSNTVAPSISGTATVGSTLTGADGSWDNNPTSYTRQWYRDNTGGGTYSAIGSATGTTYVLVDADDACHVKYGVIATNASGSSAESRSAATAIVAEPVATNSVAPTVSGSAPQGSTLTAANGTWNGMGGTVATYGYQWTRAGGNITGATASTYQTKNADVGSAIGVKVTATNTGGASSAVASSNTVTPTTAGFHSGTLTGYTVMVADIVAEWADIGAAGNYRTLHRRRLLPMSQAIQKTYATVAATGAQGAVSSPFGNPFATYAVSVAGTGGVAATSWTVNVEGSLDGTNWTTIAAHNATDGSTVWDTTGKAAHQVRANVAALTLGPASGIDIVLVAVP